MTSQEQIPQVAYHRPWTLPDTDQYEFEQGVKRIINSGELTNGKYCREFEERVKALHGCDYALSCGSATMGLFLAFRAFYRMGGRRLHVPIFEWVSVEELMRCCRDLNFEYDDIDAETWLSTSKDENGSPITGDRLIIWTFGNVPDVEENEHQHILSDMVYNFGDPYPFGDLGVLSLAPTKGVTSFEGGIILTNNREWYSYIETFRNQMSRMSEIHALYGILNANNLNHIRKDREHIAAAYDSKLSPEYHRQMIPIYHSRSKYGITVKTAHRVREQLEKHGIDYRRHYQPIGKYNHGSNAARIYNNIICLPIHHGVSVVEVVEVLNKAVMTD